MPYHLTFKKAIGFILMVINIYLQNNVVIYLPYPLSPPLLQRRGGRDFREGAKPPLGLPIIRISGFHPL
jgi:hypothetical protein